MIKILWGIISKKLSNFCISKCWNERIFSFTNHEHKWFSFGLNAGQCAYAVEIETSNGLRHPGSWHFGYTYMYIHTCIYMHIHIYIYTCKHFWLNFVKSTSESVPRVASDVNFQNLLRFLPLLPGTSRWESTSISRLLKMISLFCKRAL